jgi:NAD(P)-dependent dehydrogenase (short-subunit alcohol dehydrogenase family)
MNRIDLAGQAAVVTGAARGIGLAIAERLLQSGARVSLWDRDRAALEAAAAGLAAPDDVHTAVVDVTDLASIEAAAGDAVKRFGGVQVLVNNAGIAGANRPSWELSVEEWRQVVDIDLTGVFLCCKAVVPRMVAAGYGRVVNIASIAGKEGNPNAAHYSAAKAGVIGFTKSLGKELAKTGVIANCVTPAVIRTEIFDQMAPAHIEYMLSRVPMGRFGQKEEAAALVAWLCSRECSFSTGAVFDLSGGRATY